MNDQQFGTKNIENCNLFCNLNCIQILINLPDIPTYKNDSIMVRIMLIFFL